jgi:predicted patatin/cPLA2 family phospholipase
VNIPLAHHPIDSKEAVDTTGIALVLEGGGFRGVYTAGVLDAMMQQHLFFDYLIGVSAGAAYSVSYVSRQYQRNLEVNRFVKDKRYCSLGNLIRLGTYFDWDFVYHTIPTQIIPFDYEAYYQSSSRLHVVVTNITTGKPEYKELRTNNPIAFRDWLTATSSLPFIAQPKIIDSQAYMDGGLSDSIPVNKALADGNERAVVVLTRPKGYRKKDVKNDWMLKVVYRHYPHLVERIKARAQEYNRTLDQLERLEQEGKVFLIRPAQNATVSRLENNPDILKTSYDNALQQMEKVLPALQDWLQNS